MSEYQPGLSLHQPLKPNSSTTPTKPMPPLQVGGPNSGGSNSGGTLDSPKCPDKPRLILQNNGNYKIWVIAFLIAAVIVLVLATVDLCLSTWGKWCDANVGLTNLSDSDGSTLSYSELEDACDQFNSGSTCGNVCTIASNLKTAGNVMKVLGAISIAAGGVATIYLVSFILMPRLRFRFAFIIGLVVAAALWAIATVVYVGIFAHIMGTASNSSIGAGLSLAIALVVLFILLVGLGKVTEKRYDQDNQQLALTGV